MRQVVEDNDGLHYRHLKRHSAIEFGRANALDLLVKGKPLYDILSQLIYSLESSTEGLKCSVMLLDENSNTLSPFIAPSLDFEFLKLLDKLPVSEKVGCCGAAASLRRPVFIEDITRHENWKYIPERSALGELSACWSQPIISLEGHVFGTFAMYFAEPKSPVQDDIESLEYEAKIIALILERTRNIDQLQDANLMLEKRVTERTKELTETNVLLSKALMQKNDISKQLLEKESLASLGTMVSSLTHEISTPNGVALTAASHIPTLLEETKRKLDEHNLTDTRLQEMFENLNEISDIIERNLNNSAQLIESFKRIAIDQHSQLTRLIDMYEYVDNILVSLRPHLKKTRHKFCIDIPQELAFVSNAGAISQILTNLILNSVQHGFDNGDEGKMTIRVRLIDEQFGEPILQLVFADNGKGMDENTMTRMYEPFFTTARGSGGNGLGMHICQNLVLNQLSGHIACKSEIGLGTSFTVTFPVTLP